MPELTAGEGATTGSYQNQTEAFAINACAQWCADNSDICLDWVLRSDNGLPFGSRSPPDRYCLYWGPGSRFNPALVDSTDEYDGVSQIWDSTDEFPWLTDTVVYSQFSLEG